MFNSLPMDIALVIFEEVIQPPYHLPSTFHRRYLRQWPTPFTLCHICNTWRSIVCSSPQLWRFINLLLKPNRYPTQAELLDQWIDRVKEVPLFIRLRIDFQHSEFWIANPPHQVLRRLVSVSRLWQYLDISLPQSCLYDIVYFGEQHELPNLSSLNICGVPWEPPGDGLPFDVFCHAPKLTNIGIQLYNINRNLPWSQIQHITLLQDVSSCLKSLTHAINLQSARLSFLRNREFRRSSAICLPSIKTLQISTCFDVHLYDLLSGVILPSLIRLALDVEDCTCFQLGCVSDVLRRSSCSLDSLTIICEEIQDRDSILDVLIAAPSLTCLQIVEEPLMERPFSLDNFLMALGPPSNLATIVNSPSASQPLTILSSSLPPASRLRSLLFRGLFIFDSDLLMSFLNFRKRDLKFLKFESNYPIEFTQEEKWKLDKLKDDGVHVTIGKAYQATIYELRSAT